MTNIDNLEYGQRVRLKFYRDPDLYGNDSPRWNPVREISYGLFLRIIGEGEDREAEFVSNSSNGPRLWRAYRFEDRWAYGTSAEKLEAEILKSGEVL